MNKKESFWLIFISAIMISAFLWFFNYVGIGNIQHLLIIGVGAWFTFLVLGNSISSRSVLRPIICLATMISTMLLAIVFTKEGKPGTVRLPVLTDILYAILGFVALYLFLFRALRKVKKNTFVILGNRILLPGKHYYLWPFFAYNIGVFTKEKDLGNSLVKISTKDGDFMAKVTARVTFDIPGKTDLIERSSLVPDGLLRIVSNRIKEIAREFAQGKALNEIIGKKTTQALSACPISGFITIEFLGISVVK